ncbi:ATP-binding protein [Pseudonocardia endophytica]|uniref:ATPase family protein associated with various cellular activities (AAA) n=1 Tax=Pseudonocardia endophytica TaxID=401976 RepID=A0A4R1HKG5_PSEEN|nr:ATP-binding protein [Pseudonocardia endophytica]TCK22877.1 ATPase family protein associated with various cellular activities (AAA) [Pseudonocardia endophytica]
MTGGDLLDELRLALARLDARLAELVERARGDRGPVHPWSGVAVGPDEVADLLARPAGAVLGVPAGRPFSACVRPGSALDRLRERFGLSGFQLDVVLVALAPEIDLRYERIYGFLCDDLTRRRPIVDLVLGLLCASDAERLTGLAEFVGGSTLVRTGLLRVDPDPATPAAPLAARAVRIDPDVVAALLGLPSEPAPGTRTVTAGRSPGGLGRSGVDRIAAQLLTSVRPYLCGDTDAVARALEELADGFDVPVTELDIRDDAVRADPVAAVRSALVRATVRDEVVCLRLHSHTDLAALGDTIAGHPATALLAGSVPAAALTVPPGTLAETPVTTGPADRLRDWRDALDSAGIRLPDDEVATLARRCPLPAATAARAAVVAAGTVRRPEPADLRRVARAASGHDLDAIATRIDDEVAWDELVLDPDREAQLRELCHRIEHRDELTGSWGFGAHARGTAGVGALFTGPPGTGKTLAASVVATELGRPLHAIDLARVVSKYIGETEKNLDRIFDAADDAGSVLLFDEADALFGKRSEVRDARDRYGNIEVAHLLARIERHRGPVLLATNLRHNMDEAFLRRLAFVVEFPAPDAAVRLRIWRAVWPDAGRLAPDVDLAFLAERFELTGGYIRNVAVAAASLALADGARTVGMAHLVVATRREYQKLGRTLVDGEFGTHAHLLRSARVAVAS